MNNEVTDLDKYHTLWQKTQKPMKFQKDFIPYHIYTWYVGTYIYILYIYTI